MCLGGMVGQECRLFLASAPIAAVALLAVSGSSSASAAPSWLAPTILSETGQPDQPAVGADSRGDEVVVWSESNGGDYAIRAAVKAADGAWQPSVILGEAPVAGLPEVAVNANGAAAVAWATVAGPEDRGVSVATGSISSGEWSAPVELSRTGAANGWPQVAINEAGDAAAVWQADSSNPGPQYIQASWIPVGGNWSTPATISQGFSASGAKVAADPTGGFIAIWGGFDLIESAVLPAGSGSWQPPAVLTEQNAGAPDLAVDSRGDVVAAWIMSLGNNKNLIQVDERAHGGAWQAPGNLSEPAWEVSEPSVAVGLTGEGVITWSESRGLGDSTIEAVTKSSGGTWQPAVALSQKGPERDPCAVIDPSGDAFVTWWGQNGTDNAVQVAARQAGVTWQPSVNVSGEVPYVSKPALAVDLQGNLTAAWEVGLGYGIESVQVAGYDAAGPFMGDLVIPSSVLVDRAATFSVAPFDAWSAVGATRWDFGDGTLLEGMTVSHVYSHAGDYKVTVTGSDSLGNTTVAVRYIAVLDTVEPPSRLAPTISQVRQSHRLWREGGLRGAVARAKSRGIPIGTRFSFRLNVPAAVRFTFAGGSGRGPRLRRCLSSVSRVHPGSSIDVKCRVLVLVGHAGINAVFFDGRFSNGTRLVPGRYSLVISAANAAGRSASRTLRFRIVR